MELERRKGGRKDPWGIASATSLYPPERESKASWRPVRLSATICVLNFPLCSFQCAGKGVPLRPQTALPGKWPLSLWSVPSRTPAPPPHPSTSTRFLGEPCPWTAGCHLLTSACISQNADSPADGTSEILWESCLSRP